MPIITLGPALEPTENMSPDEEAACKSVRHIQEYLNSQELNLHAQKVKPLVELFNALSVYQVLECDLPGIWGKEAYLPEIVKQQLMRVKAGSEIEKQEQESIINDETVEQMREVATAGPPDFQSAVFHCVSDYERCNTYYVSKSQMVDAGIGCGVTFMVCVAERLIPFAGK